MKTNKKGNVPLYHSPHIKNFYNLISFEQIFLRTECSWQDTTLFAGHHRIFGNCPITETPCYRPVEVAPCPMWIQKDPKEGHDLLEAPPILHPPPYRGKKLKSIKEKYIHFVR